MTRVLLCVMVAASLIAFKKPLDDLVRTNPGVDCWERDGVDGYDKRTAWGGLHGCIANTTECVVADQIINYSALSL